MSTARPKRIVGVIGLLITLALAVTGCSGAASAGGPQNAPAAPPAAPRVKLADAPVVIDPAFRPENVSADQWFTETDEAEIKNTGLAALQIMIEDHPEYTVAGFKQTPQAWDAEVAPALQSLVSPELWPRLAAAWNNFSTEDIRISGADAERLRANVMLTNAPEILHTLDDGGYLMANTWKSDKGELCSLTDQPYEYDVEAITLRSMMNQDGSLSPTVGAQMDVTVHCQEGGKLTTRMDHIVGLTRSNSKFLVNGASRFKTSAAPAVLEK